MLKKRGRRSAQASCVGLSSLNKATGQLSMRSRPFAMHSHCAARPTRHISLTSTSHSFQSPGRRTSSKHLGGEGTAPSGVAGTHALQQLTVATGLFDGWQTGEIARFLGVWSNPPFGHRIVKIAPWQQCRVLGRLPGERIHLRRLGWRRRPEAVRVEGGIPRRVRGGLSGLLAVASDSEGE